LFFFFPFLFFLSCSWLWRQWTILMNISNSGVGKYCTNPKNTILLTLASVNIFTKMNLKKKFSMSFFFLFILYYYLPFLDGSKKKHCTTYWHLTVIVHRLITSTKNTNTKKKIKQSARGPQINQRRPQLFFGIFCYRKGVRLVKYQIRMGIKIMAKA
jgi:hypothetical protein